MLLEVQSLICLFFVLTSVIKLHNYLIYLYKKPTLV